MEISGLNIVEIIKSPVTIIAGVASGTLALKGWDLIQKKIDPVSYVRKSYAALDTVIEHLDDRLIDKFLPKNLKDKIQRDIIKELKMRKIKIDQLINKISD
tara:strand:- start:2279 stop:2581 length:303 start_codon:yes stop_codon:yes gene_type:complete